MLSLRHRPYWENLYSAPLDPVAQFKGERKRRKEIGRLETLKLLTVFV